MNQARAFRFNRRWQSRISGLLGVVLCLWLVAAATHFHTDEPDRQHQTTIAHACGLCTSLPGGGAAANVVAFEATVTPDVPAPLLSDLPQPVSRLIISHRSRAPPAA